MYFKSLCYGFLIATFVVAISTANNGFAAEKANIPGNTEKSAKTADKSKNTEKKPNMSLNSTLPTQSKSALIAYTMAGNLVRQGRVKDALRYYMTALSSDPNFVEAMSDAALIYKQLGDFNKGMELLDRAVKIHPENSSLHHNIGEIFQAYGFELLKLNEYEKGMAEINKAVVKYGEAIEYAEKAGVLSDRAGSYFRLGEISYYANADPEGAKQYWQRVLDLHTPTPSLNDKYALYKKHTDKYQRLLTWQKWAKQYLNQMAVMASKREIQPSMQYSAPADKNSLPFWKRILIPREKYNADKTKHLTSPSEHEVENSMQINKRERNSAQRKANKKTGYWNWKRK